MPFVNRTHRHARGLVGYWLGNEGSGNKVFDLSGNNNTGTLEGTAPSWTSGKFGSAVLLPGTDEYISFLSNSYLPIHSHNKPYSLEFWVTFNDLDDFSTLYSEGISEDVIPFLWMLLYNNKFTLVSKNGANDYIFNYVESAYTITQGELLHIVWTDYAGDAKLYINGNLDATNYSYVTEDFGFSLSTIGALRRSAVQFPSNITVEFSRFYNRILIPSEIAEHYAKPFAMSQKDNTALIASVEAPPPPTGGQFIMIQMSMIPLFLIFTLVCFIRGKES